MFNSGQPFLVLFHFFSLPVFVDIHTSLQKKLHCQTPNSVAHNTSFFFLRQNDLRAIGKSRKSTSVILRRRVRLFTCISCDLVPPVLPRPEHSRGEKLSWELFESANFNMLSCVGNLKVWKFHGCIEYIDLFKAHNLEIKCNKPFNLELRASEWVRGISSGWSEHLSTWWWIRHEPMKGAHPPAFFVSSFLSMPRDFPELADWGWAFN
jgi:hypothetical protein